jgi:hypothetical protein
MAQATQAQSARLAAQRAPGANPSTAIQSGQAGAAGAGARPGQPSAAQVLAPAIQLAAVTAWKVLPLRPAAYQKAVRLKAAAPLNPRQDLAPAALTPAETGLPLHLLPACAPVALAAHLLMAAGTAVPEAEIRVWHERLGPVAIGDLLEAAAAESFAGWRLAGWTRCDEGQAVPGLLYGIRLGTRYHAVVACPGGLMTSYGSVLPRAGTPAEAWHLDWAAA